MSPLAILRTALAILVVGLAAYLGWRYVSMSKQVERLPELEAKVSLLAKGYAALSEETIRRAEFDASLRANREAIHRNLEELADEDPAVRDYLSERIPDRVRGVYRDAP